MGCGIDPKEWSSYAFGMGVDRTVLLRYKIDDIRLLFENDVRMLKQFRSQERNSSPINRIFGYIHGTCLNHNTDVLKKSFRNCI